MAFILLDEQMLSNLETFPARGDIETFTGIYLQPTTQWVKRIDTDNEHSRRGRVAVSACELANAFGKLAEEEHGLDTFPRNEEFPGG